MTERWLTILMLILPMLIALVTFLNDIYIACSRQYKVMTSSLQRSAFLAVIIGWWGEKTIRSRIMVTTTVACILLYPSFHIRQGRLDEHDLRDFPLLLKINLVGAMWLNFLALIWFLLIYVLIKHTKAFENV